MNDGKSVANAFKTIEHATLARNNFVEEGDTIFIIGEYKNESYNDKYEFSAVTDPHLWHKENTIRISNLNGSPGKYITIKAYDNTTILRGDGANIFRVQNCSYLRIEGLEIEGEVERIPLNTANKVQFVYLIDDVNETADILNPTASEIKFRDQDCIANCDPNAVVDGEEYTDITKLSVVRPSYVDTRGMFLSGVHHIDIIENRIHHMPGGGLRVSECEYINIINNEVHNCSRRSYSGTHGLVVTKATSTDATNEDYRIRIERNRVHHNFNEQYSWAPSKTIITPHLDEGKGISLQRN